MPVNDPMLSSLERGRRAKWWRRLGTMARGFRYQTFDGQRIADEAALERIRALVIPPAWRHVRISPAASGKLQAIGVDTTGRVQYIYHPKFAEAQTRKKFARIERFGTYLPALRAATNEHISLDGFPREKVLAIMTRLINSLYIRMGTDRSVKTYKTYGLTTLGKKHLTIRKDGRLVFEFVGKSHVKHKKVLADPELTALLSELLKVGRGRKLFQYQDHESRPRPVKPNEINRYIKEITSKEFSSKDFRTWGATMLAALELAEIGVCEDERQIKKNIVRAIQKVAAELGNTVAVCRSSYIHPKVLDAYARGVTIDAFTPRRLRRNVRIESEAKLEEISLLRMLQNL